MNNIIISQKLIDSIRVLAEEHVINSRSSKEEYYELYYLDIISHANFLFSILNYLGVEKESKVLEIGSGIGTKCLLGNLFLDADFTGLEPCANTYKPLKDAIHAFKEANGHLDYQYKLSSGEKTELLSNEYDYILSFEVLEHVEDPLKVINEMYRVLKPGGKIFISTSNYDSFYEGHYRCLWIPYLNEKWRKRYIQFLGMNLKFLEELNFIRKLQ